jgi:hypothetical protein
VLVLRLRSRRSRDRRSPVIALSPEQARDVEPLDWFAGTSPVALGWEVAAPLMGLICLVAVGLLGLALLRLVTTW